MHFFYCFFTLTGLLASANAIRPRFYDGLQQVIGKETMTVTETITSTLYQTVTESATSVTAGPPLQHFRATITLTHTHTATASPTAERVVQTWYGGQKKYGCDKTACASCRWYYNCEGGEPAWILVSNATLRRTASVESLHQQVRNPSAAGERVAWDQEEL
ncbi:hypothetical protein D0868_01035 [Hortaea werneckii]|uniref:Uncharacterized protein n=1 Tax=Hortaea werneckii TaxID=91943 RepID=A0A3M6ZJ40_HORWE|nr:hypothetical protein D0868_01035 [Hortaea werneckii]